MRTILLEPGMATDGTATPGGEPREAEPRTAVGAEAATPATAGAQAAGAHDGSRERRRAGAGHRRQQDGVAQAEALAEVDGE